MSPYTTTPDWIRAAGDLLQWGPTGLAAIIFILAAAALMLHPQRGPLLVLFMVLGTLCFLAALAAQVFGPSPEHLRKLYAQNGTLRQGMQRALDATKGISEAAASQTSFVAHACPGGASGVPPQGADQFFAQNSKIQNAITDARAALATALTEPPAEPSK